MLKAKSRHCASSSSSSSIISIQSLILLALISLLVLFLFRKTPNPPTTTCPLSPPSFPPFQTSIPPLDCNAHPQAPMVFANLVEGVKYPFLYSLQDVGSLPENNYEVQRMVKGKKFHRPTISATVQRLLENRKGEMKSGVVVDVGANVGMATFAAAAMGFRVLAFEPVFENLQRLCEGRFFNRATDRVAIFAAAASDKRGNITFYKLVGRLDNSAVSAIGAKTNIHNHEEIATQVTTVPLDDIIPESVPVLLLKIDVQGWEHHVLKGATRILSRGEPNKAPYLIYEEDHSLLQASNSSAWEIREFLRSVGYHNCFSQDGDNHCVKGLRT